MKLLLIIIFNSVLFSQNFRFGLNVDYNILLGENNALYENGFGYNLVSTYPLLDQLELSAKFGFESWRHINNNPNGQQQFIDNYQIQVGANYILAEKSNYLNFLNLSLVWNNTDIILYDPVELGRLQRFSSPQNNLGVDLSLGFRSYINDYLSTELISGFSYIPVQVTLSSNSIIYYYIGLAVYYDRIWNF